MASITILGCAYSIPDAAHELTHFAVHGKHSGILVDCGSNPTVRLAQAEIAYDSISDLILTHFHPDHISGAPLMLMNMWLFGRKQPLRIHAPVHCLQRFSQLMDAYEWQQWPGFFSVDLHEIPLHENAPVLTSNDFTVSASPGEHMVPVVGLRITDESCGRALAYSADTAPCASIVRLAAGADVLLHEATALANGHSSAAQAGEVAARAQVGTLYLIHYDVHRPDESKLLSEARNQFSGPVKLARDLMRIEL
jgi:ribonuclease Z